MSQNHYNSSFLFTSLWERVIGNEIQKGNATIIGEKLVALESIINDFQFKIEENLIIKIHEKLRLNNTTVKRYLMNSKVFDEISTSTIDIASIYASYHQLDISEKTTIKHFTSQIGKAISGLFENSPHFAKEEISEVIIHFTENIVDFYATIVTEDFTFLKENIKILVEDLVEIVGLIFNLDNNKKYYLVGIIERSELVITLIEESQNFAQKNTQTTKQEKFEAFTAVLPKIEEELKKATLPNQKKIKELHLQKFFETGFDFTTINSYDYQNTVLTQLKVKIENLFNVVENTYSNNVDALNTIELIKQNILQWLTLPSDFRPENWVEVIHFIVKNIQNNLKEVTNGSNADFLQHILPFLEKLDYILSTIDNDDFKLIVATKEQPQIHSIELPNLLEPEEKEKSVKDKVQNSILKSETAKLKDTTAETETDESEEGKPLTISAILEYLCFDKEFGAFNKLDDEHYEVIYDLYYKTWFSNRLDNIISDVQDLFTLETLKTIWEELKAMLLNENGLNLGELIDFLVEKGVAFINQLLDFAKETITYIIDELFMLVKAIIAFFQKVDLPPVARELLKKLPPFQNLSDEVTLLHILAAIPYTLYKEFVDFEMQSQTV